MRKILHVSWIVAGTVGLTAGVMFLAAAQPAAESKRASKAEPGKAGEAAGQQPRHHRQPVGIDPGRRGKIAIII